MKVNYFKEWGEDGTVYNQTITIEKEHIEKFNEFIRAEKQEVENKKVITSDELKTLMYLNELTEGKNYTTLTTLRNFIYYYRLHIYNPYKDEKDLKRILNRNTIIKVI